MQNQNLDLKYCVFAWKLANVLLPPLFSSMWTVPYLSKGSSTDSTQNLKVFKPHMSPWPWRPCRPLGLSTSHRRWRMQRLSVEATQIKHWISAWNKSRKFCNDFQNFRQCVYYICLICISKLLFNNDYLTIYLIVLTICPRSISDWMKLSKMILSWKKLSLYQVN